MSTNIILTGIPASGKSTVGSIIAKSTNLRLLDKDTILESLFDTRGIGDADWRSKLSREADQLIQREALRAPGAVIVSWWRHPRSTRNSGTDTEWLLQLDGVLIEVYCLCNPSVAATRFKQRFRHEGHLDGNKKASDLVAEFAEHYRLGSLGLGHLITVNTEEAIDEENLISQIRLLSSS